MQSVTDMSTWRHFEKEGKQIESREFKNDNSKNSVVTYMDKIVGFHYGSILCRNFDLKAFSRIWIWKLCIISSDSGF